MTEHVPINEQGFKKTVLVLQTARDNSMTAAELREETGITNVQQFIDLLVGMGYLKVVHGKGGYPKYKAIVKFQRIKEMI